MAAAAKKSMVKADIAKNRLVFTFYGWIGKKDLDTIYTDVRFCVADLKPGFHVITDLTRCSLGSLSGLVTFRKIMNYLLEKGAGQVVRVTNRSSLIHTQIINFSARIQGYKPIYVPTMEEAEQVLAADASNQQLMFQLQKTTAHIHSGEVRTTGKVREVSVLCCTMECADENLQPDQEITIEFDFFDQDGASQQLQLSAKVLAINEKLLTAEFLDLDGERRQLLREFLVREARKESG